MTSLTPFREVWLADFEFRGDPGSRSQPGWLVAGEIRSGSLVRPLQYELKARAIPPYSTGPDCLFVAYHASAELGCHLALGWPMPERILDLCAEFRCLTAGLNRPNGATLLGA